MNHSINTQVKIKSLIQLMPQLRALRKDNKKIIVVSGTFDILHRGHIYFLEEARESGDVLVALLNSDSSVKKYKSPLRPINDEMSRSRVLAALACVDVVVIFQETTPVKLLQQIRPHIFCQGDDWSKNCPEKLVVEKYGGKIRVIKRVKGFSTSNIIHKIMTEVKV